MRIFLFVATVFFFLPVSQAGQDTNSLSYAVVPLLIANLWSNSHFETVNINHSFPCDGLLECPVKQTPPPENAQSESDDHSNQPALLGACRKKPYIRLEKLLFNNDGGERQPVLCYLCLRQYASGHLACCQHPVCRDCRKKSDGESCSLCWCSICQSRPEDEVQVSCCKKKLCKSCFDQATLKTTICPLCKKAACDMPGNTDLSQFCGTCENWVPRENFDDHLLSDHPTSTTHIWDYLYCRECRIYNNPALWTEHNRSHGNNGIRPARAQALTRILTHQKEEEKYTEEMFLMETEETCPETMPEMIEDEELAQEDSEDTVCPVCHLYISCNQMSEHMMQDDHGTSRVKTPWHRYCRNMQLYIRCDLYNAMYQ